MNLKPKKTTFNPKALVYRRFSRIERSRENLVAYDCIGNDSSHNYFIFDTEKGFVSISNEVFSTATKVIQVTAASQIFQYQDKYYQWRTIQKVWLALSILPSDYTTLAQTGWSNMGKYQMNAYYFVGSVDFIITGEVAGTKTQPIKGQIMDLESMNIKYYNDKIIMSEEDLVVVNGKLYSVESPDYSIKHMPRPYKIYYATLNSVL